MDLVIENHDQGETLRQVLLTWTELDFFWKVSIIVNVKSIYYVNDT